jgi:glycosyltransferase involved in cell wall biosynthesis
MRILIVATQVKIPDTHGGVTHVVELVRGLGLHARVLALVRRGSTGDGLVGTGFKTGGRPAVRHIVLAASFPKAYTVARNFQPDIIYERASSYGLGGLLSTALSVPLISMILDEHFSTYSLRRAHRIVATDLDLVPLSFRQKAEKVSWGANAALFRADLDREEIRMRLGIGRDDIVIGYSGSFKAWHGLGILLDAAQKIKCGRVRFLLIGDGPQRKTIENLALERGIQDRFVLTGTVPYEKVPLLLAASDLCIAPVEPGLHPGSRGRGFSLEPLKIFEYLAMNKPVVASRVPSVEALFRHGEHLWFVEPGDADELAAAIDRFSNQPETWSAIAEAGYTKVLTQHTWQNHCNHLLRIFREVLEEAG